MVKHQTYVARKLVYEIEMIQPRVFVTNLHIIKISLVSNIQECACDVAQDISLGIKLINYS